jgi:hypothetical protein
MGLGNAMAPVFQAFTPGVGIAWASPARTDSDFPADGIPETPGRRMAQNDA